MELPFETTVRLHSFLNESVRNYSYPYSDTQIVVDAWQYESNDINSEPRTYNTGRKDVNQPQPLLKSETRNANLWQLLRRSQFSLAARAE